MPPRFSVFIAASLDGYIARANGAIDFLEIVHPVDESHGYAAFFASVDTIVVGRNTYDTVLGFDDWPYTGKRVIVLTRRPVELRHGAEAFTGPVTELVPRLAGATRVYVDGADVIRQFLAADLIDDVVLSIIPIVLGGGIRLFPGGEGEHRVDLESQQSWPSGMVQVRYRVRRGTTGRIEAASD
ncbi:MAG TPA: dihydrofolate reductase family protein [Kofleriaceae bacterium]